MNEEKLGDLLEKLFNLYLSYTERYDSFGGLIDFFDLMSEKNLEKKLMYLKNVLKKTYL